ncbi:MAG: cytochrome ubiquinol oxidase subunit I, partial [Peptococcaceae bacterium]|nr:cytochrome ubiquinol oxidase subunit I [Peptococcaceae bacterium]
MDVLLLSRIQFGLTAAFHFIFPCLTIGMAWLNVIYLGRYLRTRKEEDKQLAYFWINLFVITFAMGVASGMVMVFQFGTNWADYVRYVGDIFGAPLAAEAIIAFFLEATFLGVLIWGRNRVKPGLYWLSSVFVAFGATLSAFWIIAANSWQQTPAGYIMVDGRPQLANFYEALFNHSTMIRYLHTVDACIIAGSMLVVGVSAWFLLYKPEHKEFAMKSFRVAIVTFFVASAMQFVFGHFHSMKVADTQPAKLAAFEGLFQTETEAPFLLFGIPNVEEEKMSLAIGIPKLLSFLVAGDVNAPVLGLDAFPKEEWPPINMTFYSYRIMVGLGGYFLLLSFVGLVLCRRNRLDNPLFLKLLIFSIPAGVISAEFGWMAAEIGRQPWVVYNLLLTSE